MGGYGSPIGLYTRNGNQDGFKSCLNGGRGGQQGLQMEADLWVWSLKNYVGLCCSSGGLMDVIFMNKYKKFLKFSLLSWTKTLPMLSKWFTSVLHPLPGKEINLNEGEE